MPDPSHRLLAARLGYVAVILLATLTDLDFQPATAPLAARIRDALSLEFSARDAVDGLRNVLLFAGWGLVWSITAPTRRLWRSVLTATATGMLLSMSVETAQLFSPRRHASILDVLSNTAGACAGAVVVVVLLKATAAARSARSYVGIPMFVVAVSYGSAALLEIVLPGLRQEMLGGATGGPMSRFRYALDAMDGQLPTPGEFLLQVLLMLPAGGFMLAALVERGWSYRRALMLTAAIAVLAALLLELARGVTGQPIEMGMFITHALGLAGGALLAHRFLPRLTARFRGRARPLALLGFYTALLVLWRWRPFTPEQGPGGILDSFALAHLMPLQALTMKMDIFSASVVAVGFLLHFPIGALLAVWPLRLRGALAHVLPGIWIVLVLEAGQLLIADRYFDITDIIIGTAGVLCGWVLIRRAGFRPYGEALPARAAAVTRRR
jgi:glycopeptide antibiotics resistance protein